MGERRGEGGKEGGAQGNDGERGCRYHPAGAIQPVGAFASQVSCDEGGGGRGRGNGGGRWGSQLRACEMPCYIVNLRSYNDTYNYVGGLALVKSSLFLNIHFKHQISH